MGPILALSWLVGAQVGAKRGELTPLGKRRGTELEPKRALGEPKEAPKELKRDTIIIDPGSRGVVNESGGPA